MEALPDRTVVDCRSTQLYEAIHLYCLGHMELISVTCKQERGLTNSGRYMDSGIKTDLCVDAGCTDHQLPDLGQVT